MTDNTFHILTGAFFGPTTAKHSDEVDLERQQAEDTSFDGNTFSPARDEERLRGQLTAVQSLMADGHWRTLTEIAIDCHLSDASLPGISARVRDLRKSKFGAHTIERRYLHNGIWAYRMVITNHQS